MIVCSCVWNMASMEIGGISQVTIGISSLGRPLSQRTRCRVADVGHQWQRGAIGQPAAKFGLVRVIDAIEMPMERDDPLRPQQPNQ